MTQKDDQRDPDGEPTDAEFEALSRAMGVRIREEVAKVEAARLIIAMRSPPVPLDLSPEAVAQREADEQAKHAENMRVAAEINAEVARGLEGVLKKRALRKQAEADRKARE